MARALLIAVHLHRGLLHTNEVRRAILSRADFFLESKRNWMLKSKWFSSARYDLCYLSSNLRENYNNYTTTKSYN